MVPDQFARLQCYPEVLVVLVHAGLPGNELTDNLATSRAELPCEQVSCPHARAIAKFRNTLYTS